MKEQLQATPFLHGLTSRKMCKSLCIILLTICGVAHGQPKRLSQIPNESKNFVTINGRLYYSVSDSLKAATSTSAPVLVKKTGEPILRIYTITFGTNFFFVTQTSSGQRLWRSDGTTANTVQVFAETQITPLLVYHSQLFLRINSSSTGTELWKMDASYNVTLVKDVNPGASGGFFDKLVINNDLLYFFSNVGSRMDLWRSDGTTAGTVLSVDLDDTELYSASGFYELISVNNVMFFTRNYEDAENGDRTAELWKSNGSASGTSIVTTFTNGYFYNYLSDFLSFNGKLYFFHSIDDPAYTYISVSDGTASGTRHLDLVSIDGNPRRLIDAGSYFLYYGDSQSYTTEIEKSDGTTSSEVHEFSYYHSAPDEYINLTYTNGRAFFTDDTGQYYSGSLDLWQADLASGVTRPVQDIYGISLNGTQNITAANGSIFFTRTVSGQMSLWYYDPSTSPSSCDGTGNIFQEIWKNVPGTDVKAFHFTAQPTHGSRPFTTFETSQYYANNYASRMRAYLCVPQTGDYTFWISSDDQSELYLSEDSDETKQDLIASVYGYTPFRNYDKYPSQKSRVYHLEAGRKYYIEARHKEADGNDFISVGWQLPDGTMERPIPGNRLIAITTPANETPVITITSPQPNQSFPSGSSIRIAANVTDADGIKSVSFTSAKNGVYNTLAYFNAPPYEYQWDNPAPGTYQIVVDANDNKDTHSSQTVTITVEEAPCAGTGTITREIWTGVPGTSVSSIPVSRDPNYLQQLTSLSTQNYWGNNYGSRIRGYVCAPATGAYTFWLAGDDDCELWLSSSDAPAAKTRIAYFSGATNVNQWDKFSTQRSGSINLVQGHKYYIEVLQKEADGADHVEVGWQIPAGPLERPIPGNRLIPFGDASTSAASFAVADVFSSEEESTESKGSIYPNPATSGQQVAIKLPGGTDAEVQIDIQSVTGVSVQTEILSSNAEEVIIDLKPSIASGMYLVRVSGSKRRWATKLQVR
jgi:ELWxxDGT repeat protein